MSQNDIESNYIIVNENSEIKIDSISFTSAFGINPLSDDCFFAFESTHTPFQRYVYGTLPRTDLVIQNHSTGESLAAIEVKLTALPDHTTCDLSEDKYGSEIVVRPDTIVYLACSLATTISQTRVAEIFPSQSLNIADWSDPSSVLEHIVSIHSTLKTVVNEVKNIPVPFLLQPVWKTQGKSPRLSTNCLDTFLWSDVAFLQFILEISNYSPDATKINRPTRASIWIYKMLSDFATNGQFDHNSIIDELSYNTKNDKAFSSNGHITNKYMSCNNLITPRVTKADIQNIILGGGQNLLSPERRFDAIIYNSPDLFA